jgi:hypothetical protein
MKIAEPLKKQGLSYENILIKLEDNTEIDKVPSKGTLVTMLRKYNSQSA